MFVNSPEKFGQFNRKPYAVHHCFQECSRQTEVKKASQICQARIEICVSG